MATLQLTSAGELAPADPLSGSSGVVLDFMVQRCNYQTKCLLVKLVSISMSLLVRGRKATSSLQRAQACEAHTSTVWKVKKEEEEEEGGGNVCLVILAHHKLSTRNNKYRPL